jgi:hypothetical protein
MFQSNKETEAKLSTLADRFAVNEFIDADKVQADVSVDMDNLQGELQRQPGLIYYYVAMHARAEAQHSSIKLRLEAAEAKVSSNIRTAAAAAGEKPPTVDAVKAGVRLHTEIVKLDQALIKAELVVDTLKAVCEGMRHKRDSLQMLGFMERDERKGRREVEEDIAARSDRSRWQANRHS